RQCERSGQRPRDPDRHPRHHEEARARSGHDHAPRGRQVRQRLVQGVRRTPRRRCVGGERAVGVLREGKIYSQEYKRGVPTGPMTTRAADKKDKGTGTTVRFKPDADVFEDTVFHWDTIAARLRELAFLNSGLTIHLTDAKSGKDAEYFYKGGILEFVKYLNQNKEVLHSKPVFFSRERDNVSVEVAFQYNDGYAENLLSFVNNINTIEGGTHVGGFRAALTGTLVNYANREGMTRNLKADVGGEDVREGLV